MKLSKNVAALIGLALAVPMTAAAAEQDLQQRLDALSKEVDSLKQQVKQTDKKSLGRWLEISGDYMFRYDNLRGEVPGYSQGFIAPPNPGIPGGYDDTYPQLQAMDVPGHKVKDDALYSNRFGLNLKAKATQNVSVNARLLMYKIAGGQDDSALRSGNTSYSFDRAGLFDGTVGHVPGDSRLAVDRVYATWNNIGGQPVWFSIGRRPSTDGSPLHLKNNAEPSGNSGVPALLVNYAFDGATLGYAPDIEALPGAYVKLCYGRGFDSGIRNSANSLKDTDMLGFNLVPYDTDLLHLELQYNRAMNIFNAPDMLTGPFSFLAPTANIGNIDWYGANIVGKIKNVGFGDLNWFVNGAISRTDPNSGTLSMANPYLPPGSPLIQTPWGLGYTGAPQDETGWALYAGVRYDIKPSNTKIGFEYNHGSKNWITFSPAEDDRWTAKVGTRGNVYEGYVIQELNLQPISSYFAKAFFRLGYQYYDFEYTGSNSWLGAPMKISSLAGPQLTAPMENAQDLYATFEVKF